MDDMQRTPRYGYVIPRFDTLVKVFVVEPKKPTRMESLREWSRDFPWPYVWLMAAAGGALGFLGSLH